MKRFLYMIISLGLIAMSCQDDDDIKLFEKSADERAAEAIASLKADLVAPEHGWRVKYTPVEGAGSYVVLLDFDNNNKVNIRTDLSAGDGDYFDQTITYRIDNSLGLELIFETYSFFSYLFEEDQATFGAEYEFDFVNKTPDNRLVFSSKTDISSPTVILFEPAAAGDESMLGVALAQNLDTLANDLDLFSSSLQLVYDNKDLIFYLSLDESKRIIDISAVAAKSDVNQAQPVNFTSGYLVRGDSIVFNHSLQGVFLGTPITVKRIFFDGLSEQVITPCIDPVPVHSYAGVTSQNDPVHLETTYVNMGGATFAELSDFYFSPLTFIFNNGEPVADAIAQDVAGALEMHLYYGLPLGNNEFLYGIGFVIQNADGSVTFALREFTPALNGNNIIFNFEPDISLFGNPETDANLDNINIYLDALTQDNSTYVFKFAEDIYEFTNPCTGWSFVFVNAN